MFSSLFFRNRQLLVVVLLVVLVGGLSAFLTLPRMEDPRIKNRNPLVITMLPGATAERVEALITKPIETELRDLAEIKTIESQSRAEVSFVQIELDDFVSDTEKMFTRIRDKLAEVESALPSNATKPELDDERGAIAYTLILSVTKTGNQEGISLNLLNRTAEEVADRLRNVSGTDLVRIYGQPDEEIEVELDRDKLADLGLSARFVVDRIKAADSKLASGALRSSSSDLVIEVEGAFSALSRIESIPILNGPQGALVYLRDIAQIKKKYRDPQIESAIADGDQAIYVAVRMLDDRRVDRWMNSVQRELKRFDAESSDQVAVKTVFQQQHYTDQRLGELGINLVMGSLVVVAVILIMMGWRSAILVGLALPLVSAMVLFAMQLIGLPLHQMSIFGLIVAIGLLIDNAIVVVDDVSHHLRHGADRAEAISMTVEHLFVPLLGSTATTILAFLPIYLLPGSVGEFVGSIATTVILALLFSFLLSMTVIPALTGIFWTQPKKDSWWETGIKVRGAESLFDRFLGHLLKKPVLGILLAISIPLVGFMRAGELRNQFFPGADRNQFYLQVWMPPQSSLESTSEMARRIEEEIRLDERVSRIDWLVGGSMPTVYYNLVMDQDNKPNYAQAVVTTGSARDADELISALQSRLDQLFPDAQVIVRKLAQGPPVEAPIELRLYGPSVSRLKELGQQIQEVLYRTPEVLHTRTTFDISRPKINFVPDESEAQRSGLSLADIASQLQVSLEGETGGTLIESTEVLPVRVRFGDQVRGSLDQVASSRINVPLSREWMPLESIGELQVVPQASAIPRRNGERCNTIQAFVTPEALPPEVTNNFLARLNELGVELPAGYRLQVGGDSEELANSMSNLFRYAPILSVLMLATVVLSFRSFLLGGVIGVIALLSSGIGFLTLWCVGFPLGFNPLIGTAGLIGLAINDSIVVLSQIRSNARARAGDLEAIRSEVQKTGRHVISTTLTTIGGFVPLLLAGGTFWPPLAVVIAGGVGGATILATVFVPCVYVLVRRWVETGVSS